MNSPAKRAVVVGIDGASMELVLWMVAKGHMPHVAQLIARGVYRPMIGVFLLAGHARGNGFQHPQTGSRTR